MKELNVDRLREVLRYDAVSGLFYWINPPKNHPKLQEYVAGGIASGYVMIKIDGQKYKAHRLAWLYAHGEWPLVDVDHENGCPLDNRLTNLRQATNAQNQANKRRIRGKTTPKGVKPLPSGRYLSRITVNKKLISLGVFDTPDEAHAAYARAATTHYGTFARAA